MITKNIAAWIGYWDRSSMGPCIDKVESFADLLICRKFNRCMNVGVMRDVSDADMWEALILHRKGQ